MKLFCLLVLMHAGITNIFQPFTMKHLILFVFAAIISQWSFSQNVGIGISAPIAGLHIVNNDGIIASGVFDQGSVINATGVGSKMIWYPKKAAFRAGFLDIDGAAFWDDVNMGQYSIGLGYNAKAQGTAAVAIGRNAEAGNSNAAAIGYSASATGFSSIAIAGFQAYAKSQFAVAIGNYAYANSYGSVAIGRNIHAGYDIAKGYSAFAIGTGETDKISPGGHYATASNAFVIGNSCVSVASHAFAIGNNNQVGQDFYYEDKGEYSFAFGNSNAATGSYSFAIGNNAHTNNRLGSMVVSSRLDGVKLYSPADYHFLAQFAGGFHLSSNNAGTLGVILYPNTSSWVSLCDSTRKEQILPLKDEDILSKLSAINYFTWKYKDDPDVANRHYGIMAQDFYAAFGTDSVGKIGNDTMVNPIDLLGVAYSAIKALEKRTSNMEQLEKDNLMLKERLDKLEKLELKN